MIAICVAIVAEIGVGTVRVALAGLHTHALTNMSGFVFHQRSAYGLLSGDVAGPTDSVPSCLWPTSTVDAAVPAAEVASSCQPIPAGRTVGVFRSPAGGARFYDDDDDPYNGVVRVARFDRSTRTLSAGAVVMSYGDYSGGTRPEYVYQGDWVWLYDSDTPQGAQLPRLSADTGALLQRDAMPPISEPIIGANNVGFWMGQATNSNSPSSLPLGIYVVPIDARAPLLVKATAAVVAWMHPRGTTMSIGVFFRPNQYNSTPVEQIWQFDQADT
jgi:hypothetical protein